MRIAIAEIGQETDSFSPLITTLDDFETYGLWSGAEILEKSQGFGPLGGYLEVVSEAGSRPASDDPASTSDAPIQIETVPLLRAWASAGGPIADETLATLIDGVTTGLQQNLPLDAVFLSLHGAASTVSIDDAEGTILSAVREVIGDELPLVVALDHHANITAEMVAHADALVGHETQPHHPFDTGCKAARLLIDMLRGGCQPHIVWRNIPLITPQDQFLTAQGPMKEWFDQARQSEQDPRVLDVSPYPMQPWLDVDQGGWSVVVHTDGAAELAEQIADEMARTAWRLRDTYWESERVAPDAAVSQTARHTEGLVLLSDTGDSVYGGAPGDSTCVLEALLRNPPPRPALVPLVDPLAVEAVREAGVGASITLDVGARQDTIFSRPVTVTGQIASVCAGLSSRIGDRGLCHIGPSALLEIGTIKLVLLAHRNFAINHPLLYTHLGLDIAEAGAVVLKTASNFQFFADWRTAMIRVDSPGMTQSDLHAFTWKRRPRPLYPLDALDDWDPSASA